MAKQRAKAAVTGSKGSEKRSPVAKTAAKSTAARSTAAGASASKNNSRAIAVKRAISRAARPTSLPPAELIHVRELFWNNVIREILTALSAMTIAALEASAASEGAEKLARSAGKPSGKPVEDEPEIADAFDGRMAAILANGNRIPIAGVAPLFACGVPGTIGERSLSMAVECTVFQITTPAGEAYTLPLHEIRGFHALTDELMAQVTAAAQNGDTDESETPFGFAAFTSLARGMPAPVVNDRREGPPMSGEPAL